MCQLASDWKQRTDWIIYNGISSTDSTIKLELHGTWKPVKCHERKLLAKHVAVWRSFAFAEVMLPDVVDFRVFFGFGGGYKGNKSHMVAESGHEKCIKTSNKH